MIGHRSKMTAVDYDEVYEEFLRLTSSSSSSSFTSSPSPINQLVPTKKRKTLPVNQSDSNQSDLSSNMPSHIGHSGLPAFPGGLEVLWREVPVDYQRLISPYDVPETARFRGYFTVQELLTLKRTLAQRFNSMGSGVLPHHGTIRMPPPPPSAIAAAQAAVQANNIMTANAGVGVGAVVKEALEVLDPQQQQQSSNNNQHLSSMDTGSNNQSNQNCSSTSQMQNQMNSNQSVVQLGLNGMAQAQQSSNTENQLVPSDVANNNNTHSNQHCHSQMQNQMSQRGLQINGMSQLPHGYMSCPVNDGGEHISVTPDIKHLVGSPLLPPYRTATLVFKLLQIGHYQIRSYSDANPNKLRVLFNTQRLSYECQLPLVQTTPGTMQPLRKILTIDIGFEQISVMKFGTDKLQLRVEGPPCLTVTYSPSNEEPHHLQISQQDQYLLDQIDKGQVKLSPHHQIFFLNERLVHLLENQFREHPRFSYLLTESQECPPPPPCGQH